MCFGRKNCFWLATEQNRGKEEKKGNLSESNSISPTVIAINCERERERERERETDNFRVLFTQRQLQWQRSMKRGSFTDFTWFIQNRANYCAPPSVVSN